MTQLVDLSDLALYEAALNSPLSDTDRVYYLEQLAAHYVYTHPSRARRLLREQFALIDPEQDADYLLTYYVHLASLESQVYNHAAAFDALQSALLIVEERGDFTEKIEVYLEYIGTLINLDLIKEATTYFERCERLLESVNSDRFRAWANCRHGFLYLHYYNYPKAIVKFREAERLLAGESFPLQPKDHYFYTLVEGGLGQVYARGDTPEKAAAALRRAIERCETYGMRARLPWHQLDLGNILLSIGRFREAVPYFQAVIDSQAGGSQSALATAYTGLALTYLELGESNRTAVRLLDDAEDIHRATNPPDQSSIAALADIGVIRAELLSSTGNFTETIALLRQTITDVLELSGGESDVSGAPNPLKEAGPQLLETVANAFGLLAQSHAATGNYELAYRDQLRNQYYRDRYAGLVDQQRQRENEAKFEAEAREEETERLRLKASQLQLRALRAQMNPHFLYNALNSIQSFITTNDAATASRYLAKFAMLMRQSLEYTDREYITLEDEAKFLSDYLVINCHLRFEGKLTYGVHISEELEEDFIGIPTMILQPYVENAIEHGLRGRKRGHVEVHFLPHGERTILATVTDDGVGRKRAAEIQAKDPTRQFHQSRGTEITHSRLQLLSDEADVSVETDDVLAPSGQVAGTRVRVVIPTVDVVGKVGR